VILYGIVSGGFLGDIVGLALKEGRRRLLPLAAMFSGVAIVALAVVITTPKVWEASALIIAEGHNIMKPLLEGRAVPTTIADQTALVNQVMQSRRIMREIATLAGEPILKDPREEEKLLFKLRGRVRISNEKGEMIRVSYRDSDPKRTYLVANQIADIYVREGAASKERESREAFEFIDKQVNEYAAKLGEAHEKLLAYYKGDDRPAKADERAAGAGGDTGAATPDAHQPSRPRVSPERLASLRAEEATLTSQLGRRPAAPAGETRNETRQSEEHTRARILQLQAELDRLLTTYTDEHPDVKRVRRDLATANDEMHKVVAARTSQDEAQKAASALDDSVTAAARGRLEEVRKQIAALTGVRYRPRTGAPALLPAAREVVPEMRNVGQDTQLSEFLHRYEATRDVYQDLLKRRENARVSMEMDVEHQGLTLRVQEPAEMPLTATGLRMFQQTAIGLLLATLIPLGFLVGFVRLDPRVRNATQIERLARLPLLIAIPPALSPNEAVRDRSRRAMAIALVACTLAVYGIVFVVRLTAAK
jgi:polysaccharide chain length determinant protein (PEP-CTERM system associated)